MQARTTPQLREEIRQSRDPVATRIAIRRRATALGIDELARHSHQIIKRESQRSPSQLDDNRLLSFREARKQALSRMRAIMNIVTATPVANRTHRDPKLIRQLVDVFRQGLDVSPGLRCRRRVGLQPDVHSFVPCASSLSTSHATHKE